MRRSPRLDHSQEAEKELAVAALLACTAEVRQPTFGVAREEHVRLPLAIRIRGRVQPSSAANPRVVQEDHIMHPELEECAQVAARARPAHRGGPELAHPESQRGDCLDDGERQA